MLLIVGWASSLWCVVESGEAPLDTGMRRCDGFNRGEDGAPACGGFNRGEEAAPAAGLGACSGMGVSGHRHAPV